MSSSFKGVSRIFENSLKGDLGKLKWCFKEVSKNFQESIKSVSRKFQR